jgi:hypothetical protein
VRSPITEQTITAATRLIETRFVKDAIMREQAQESQQCTAPNH